mgnify:CR=1 FL=1
MKKGALIFCLTLALSMILFCMTACQHGTADTPDVLSPAIMIDGVVYYSLGKAASFRCAALGFAVSQSILSL